MKGHLPPSPVTMPGPALSTLVPSKDSEPKKKQESESNCAEPGGEKGEREGHGQSAKPGAGGDPALGM